MYRLKIRGVGGITQKICKLHLKKGKIKAEGQINKENRMRKRRLRKAKRNT